MTLELFNANTKMRFFQAIDAIIVKGESLRTICLTTGIDRRNLHAYRKKGRIPASWISALVAHYGVSAEWLLIGKGKMFN